MAVDIKVPSVGESITEGTLARWFKKDGDAVRADEPVFELETEKATTEVAAPAAGTLRITAKEGQTVAVGAVVGRVEEGAAAQPAREPKRTEPPVRKDEPKPAKAPENAKPAAPKDKDIVLSPAARQVA